MSDLYISTRYTLRSGVEQAPNTDERAQECRRQARALLLAQGVDETAIARVWMDFPERSFLRFTPAQIAWQTAGIANFDQAGPLVLIEAHGARGGTEIFVHAADRDGLFAAITAVLDRLRLSVQDARVVTSRSGMSLDSFLVLDSDGRALSDSARITRVQRALLQALTHTPYRAELALRAPSRSLRHFPIATRIEFSVPERGRTQLAVVCADRPGLLASIAHLFRERRIRVHDARIATFGERVEDFFLISDEHDAPFVESARQDLHAAMMLLLDTHREHHGAA